MPTPDELVQQMRTALRVTEPDLDTTVGSVSRKILDVVAEVAAEAYADQHLLDYTYDIDSKSGADLDDFCNLFGIFRYPERRATGEVFFERQTPAETDIAIPVGTQVATQDTPAIVFSTVVPATLRKGDTSIAVPVEAQEGGERSNVAADTITRRLVPLNGIAGVTNFTSTTGGRNAESDESLRRRFKRTVFRNLAGTEQMYLGVALDDEAVNRANVIGVSKRQRQRLEVTGGTGSVTLKDARHVYTGTQVFGPNIDAGDILVEGVHYTFSATAAGSDFTLTVTQNAAGAVPDGVYDLDVEYVPNASRNDPANGITNRVDVYAHGERALAATETLVFDRAQKFVNDPASPLHYQNFTRKDGSNPQVGNYFMRYGFVPVLDGATDDEIRLDTTNTPNVAYDEGDANNDNIGFYAVNDITNQGGGAKSLGGIEVISQVNHGGVVNDDPEDEQVFSVTYTFNEVPRAVQEAIEQWRLLTTDVMVHKAKPIRLNIYFVVILSRGFSSGSVTDDVYDAVRTLVSSIGFSQTLQVSDVVRAAANVDGVDAVRLATSGDDAAAYAMQRVAADGITVLDIYDSAADLNGVKRPIDVRADDDEVPVLNNVFLDVRAENTYFEGQ